jgi:uncharacterized membrane protein HdeD (DUF308 family)
MVIVARNWWAFVLRGIVALLFGIITFIAPPVALLTLVFMFAFYAIADGIFSIIAAFHLRRAPEEAPQQPWWALLLGGILSLIAGILAFLVPAGAAFALLIIIAAWAIVSGVMSLVAAVRLRKVIRGEWLLALIGVLSILFGILLILFPGPGALAVVLWIGAYAFVMGIMLIVLGFRLRKWLHSPAGAATTATAHHGHDFPTGVAHGH